MIVTRIAIALGTAFFLFLCYLAIHGFTAITPVVITALALLVLIGGGNLMRGRQAHRRPPRFAIPPPRQAPGPQQPAGAAEGAPVVVETPPATPNPPGT